MLQQKCKHSCTGEYNLSTEKKWAFSVSFSRKGSRTVLLAWNRHIRAKLNFKCQRCKFKIPEHLLCTFLHQTCVLDVDEYHKCGLGVVGVFVLGILLVCFN